MALYHLIPVHSVMWYLSRPTMEVFLRLPPVIVIFFQSSPLSSNEFAHPLLGCLSTVRHPRNRGGEVKVKKVSSHHFSQAEGVLDEMEATLGADDRLGMWLCGPIFSSADVGLACLLFSLETLGLDERFWKDGRRPNLSVYKVNHFFLYYLGCKS